MPMLARMDWGIEHKFGARVRPRRGGRRRDKAIGWLLLVLATSGLLLWLGYRQQVELAWLRQLPPAVSELLSLVEAAGAFTLGLIWIGLWWRQRSKSREAQKAILTAESLYALSPRAFEKYVADLFRRKGYKVRHRGRSGDAGVDLELVSPSGKRAIAQCKRYRTMIGPEIVRELFGTMIHEGVAHAFLVTTADISPSAREWARGKPMTLIDGGALVEIGMALDLT